MLKSLPIHQSDKIWLPSANWPALSFSSNLCALQALLVEHLKILKEISKNCPQEHLSLRDFPQRECQVRSLRGKAPEKEDS